MIETDLNILRDRAYKIACDHGFHDNRELMPSHWLCLVISELMEAVEAHRKEKYANVEAFNEEMSRYGQSENVQSDSGEYFMRSFEKHIKDSLEDELADAIIRLLDFAGLCDVKIEEFTEETLAKIFKTQENRPFTSNIFVISQIPYILIEHSVTVRNLNPTIINGMLGGIMSLCKSRKIDFYWFICKKMNYNELRAPMHGKKY